MASVIDLCREAVNGCSLRRQMAKRFRGSGVAPEHPDIKGSSGNPPISPRRGGGVITEGTTRPPRSGLSCGDFQRVPPCSVNAAQVPTWLRRQIAINLAKPVGILGAPWVFRQGLAPSVLSATL